MSNMARLEPLLPKGFHTKFTPPWKTPWTLCKIFLHPLGVHQPRRPTTAEEDATAGVVAVVDSP